MNFIYDSTLFRSISFLRVKSPFGWRYSFLYPGIFVAILFGLSVYSSNDLNYWHEGGVLGRFAPLLSVLFPFYIAALAAVATFNGSADIDKSFPLDSRGRAVTLNYRGCNGVVEPRKITQRHYLSLLFGYCCVVSAGLLLFICIIPLAASLFWGVSGIWIIVISRFIFWVCVFLLLQIMFLTLIAVYYLSDKIHRDRIETGNSILDKIDTEN